MRLDFALDLANSCNIFPNQNSSKAEQNSLNTSRVWRLCVTPAFATWRWVIFPDGPTLESVAKACNRLHRDAMRDAKTPILTTS
jgi:hypothetical protein